MYFLPIHSTLYLLFLIYYINDFIKSKKIPEADLYELAFGYAKIISKLEKSEFINIKTKIFHANDAINSEKRLF